MLRPIITQRLFTFFDFGKPNPSFCLVFIKNLAVCPHFVISPYGILLLCSRANRQLHTQDGGSTKNCINQRAHGFYSNRIHTAGSV